MLRSFLDWLRPILAWLKQFYDPVVFEDDISRSVAIFALKVGLSVSIAHVTLLYMGLLVYVASPLLLTFVVFLMLLIHALALYSLNRARLWIIIAFCAIAVALIATFISIFITGFLTGFITVMVAVAAVVAVSSGWSAFIATVIGYSILGVILYVVTTQTPPKPPPPMVIVVAQFGLHVYGSTVIAILLYSYRIVVRRASVLYVEKVKAEQSLRAIESNTNLLNRIVHTVDEMMFTVDNTQRITLVNNALSSTLGYSSDELIGQPLEMILDVERRLCLCKNGQQLWVAASSAALTDDHGAGIGTLWIMRDQTALRQAESALDILTRRYEQAIRIANAGVFEVILPDSLYLDPNLRKLVGLDDENTTARLVDWISYIHPDDVMNVVNTMYSLIDGKATSGEINMRLQTERGSLGLMIRAMSITNEFTGKQHIIGTVIDVSERQTIEQELRIRDRILQAVNHAAERYLTTDDWMSVTPEVLADLGDAAEVDSVFLYENQRYNDETWQFVQRFEWLKNPQGGVIPPGFELSHKTLGIQHFIDQLVQGSPIIAHVREMPPLVRNWLEASGIKQSAVMPILVNGNWWGFINFNLHTDEDNQWALVRLELLQTAAGVLGLAIQRNLAEHQKFQDAIERERLRILSTFMTKAVHEFKTPLAIISADAYLVSRLGDGEGERRILKANQIQEQVKQINKLVEAMVLMTRLDIEPFTATHTISLNWLVENAVAPFYRLAASKGITFTVDRARETPIVLCDEGKLEQAITNLVENAVTFTERGGIVRVTVQVMDGVMGYIAIADTGIGMDEETRDQIFDRFYRHDQAHSTRGFGLGLPIAKRIIELHGGNINVESQLNHGSTFTVRLPLSHVKDMPPSTVNT